MSVIKTLEDVDAVKTSIVEPKSDNSLLLPKISEWSSFSGHFQLAMIEAVSAKKKIDQEDLATSTKTTAAAAKVKIQKPGTKTVKWNLPNQPVGNFGKKLMNIKRATFATNIQVSSSLPRKKITLPVIRQTPPEIQIVVEKAEPTVIFVDNEPIAKDLRPRSAHELSHERANRLRKEELDKCNGKYCNRLDVKFRKRPSTKFQNNVSKTNNPKNERKLPVIICQDTHFSENTKIESSQLPDAKCRNWLHTCCKYLK